MASPTLYLVYDDIPQHNYFEVIDEEEYVIGRGKTESEAIKSARKVSNAPIEFQGHIIEGDDF